MYEVCWAHFIFQLKTSLKGTQNYSNNSYNSYSNNSYNSYNNNSYNSYSNNSYNSYNNNYYYNNYKYRHIVRTLSTDEAQMGTPLHNFALKKKKSTGNYSGDMIVYNRSTTQ
ncbi:hypothetical protein PMLGA01_130022300 [Plasmodium malariae]|uniref:Uncharacterized protein n=1 Tax=Plasmodium malariae TaxID=5858 RepID=A0A1C3KEX4_PLAMA|nr:hypothetical protein PMLGA01_130022300 [Plasmodium malariae]